jgi:hypothetical protein
MNHDPAEDDVQTLLRSAQSAGGHVEEFARIHCWTFSDACAAALRWQREGRGRVLTGEDPEVIRQETERRIEEVRETLRGKLARLLAWGRETGRA